jgi:hypothetical protein
MHTLDRIRRPFHCYPRVPRSPCATATCPRHERTATDATATWSLTCGPLGSGAHLSVTVTICSQVPEQPTPKPGRICEPTKNHQPASPPPSATAGLRRLRTIRLSSFVRQPPARHPWAAPPPYQVAPTGLTSNPKGKKKSLPFSSPHLWIFLFITVDCCGAWAIWPRKLGVE